MTVEAYAHTPADVGGQWQLLNRHLRQVSLIARGFGEGLGAGDLAGLAGALHDVGKYSEEFQSYLRDAHAAKCVGKQSPRRGPGHKTAGARLLRGSLDLLTLVILGHHGGLVSPSEAKSMPLNDSQEVIDRAQAAGSLPSAGDMEGALRELTSLVTSPLDADVLARLVYSCLVDADALDTEAHFLPDTSDERGGFPSIAELDRQLTVSLRRKIEETPTTEVNTVRRRVHEDCLRAAEGPPGLYSLTVPTGGGKTLSSLAFALRHARLNGLERVIYAIPYTSIIDQTAEAFRRELPVARAVLEHHSSVEWRSAGQGDEWQELAAENWDTLIVVTTTVQFFESLFSNRPGRCRKNHRIARSVVVLDEVQTLPPRLLDSILSVLRALAERYSTTIVLCTATQPALEESPHRSGLPQATEIAGDPEADFAALERVKYEVDLEPVAWPDLAERVRQHSQCLVVLNTKKDALRLLEALGDPDALHLSTSLCPAHRLQVLKLVRQRLDTGAPCVLVSTQVVEAGVDLDFPVVFRALGPLDGIVQAGGRCNREGSRVKGTVYVFDPLEGSRPGGAYRTAISHTETMMRSGALDLNRPGTFRAYFERLYADVEQDPEGIQEARKNLDFPLVADRFRLIKEDSAQVLVPYDDRVVERLCDEATALGAVTRLLWRRGQRHSVSVRRRDLDRYEAQGLTYEVVPGGGLYRWVGRYDRVTGLSEAALEPTETVC